MDNLGRVGVGLGGFWVLGLGLRYLESQHVFPFGKGASDGHLQVRTQFRFQTTA